MRKYMQGESNSSSSSDHDVIMGKKVTRRFSDEQIKSLESVFKREKKVEPRKKLEMARELGLHPRQVAIWFQNRRARWKSKQVEQDYNNLKAQYDSLNHRFQSLNKEKHELLHQLSSLCSQLKDDEENTINKELDGEHHDTMAIYSDEDEPMIPIKQELDNININNMMHQKPIEEESSDQLGSLFDHSCSNWWDIWSSN